MLDADAVRRVVEAPSVGRRVNDIAELYDAARGLDLDCLVEVHDEEELERALQLDADVIGINNRNLEEGTVDVATTYELMPDVPAIVSAHCLAGTTTETVAVPLCAHSRPVVR